MATGGFSNTKQLLPRPLDMTVYARTVVLAELDQVQKEHLQLFQEKGADVDMDARVLSGANVRGEMLHASPAKALGDIGSA